MCQEQFFARVTLFYYSAFWFCIVVRFVFNSSFFLFYGLTPVVTGNGQTARGLLRKARDGGHFPRLRDCYAHFFIGRIFTSLARISARRSFSISNS